MRVSRFGTHRPLRLLTGLLLLAMSSATFAASTWGSAACSGSPAVDCGVQGNVLLTADAFSTTAAGPAFAAASISNTSTTTSGLGVVAAGSSADTSDSLDNAASTDAIRLKFTNAAGSLGANFNLTSITLSTAGDADFSLFAWVGTGEGAVLGKTTTQLLSVNSGWKHIGNYANATNESAVDVTAGSSGTFSSYWLVSAYAGDASQPLEAANDVFKVLAIAGGLKLNEEFKTPEPGSLALVGASLVGLMAVRRKRQVVA